MKCASGFAIFLWLCTTFGAGPAAFSSPVAGDTDGSGALDAVDVQLVINVALGLPFSGHTDIDYCGATTAVDVQLVINAVLGYPIDSDGDGLCDVGEAHFGTVSTNPDTDGDGISDGQEVLDGTNPLVPDIVNLVAAPNVVGMTRAAAEMAIVAASLTVGTETEQYSSTVAAGLVLTQDPVAGTSIAQGSSVSLIISLGPAAGGGEAPVIHLLGESVITIKVYSSYADAGATAADAEDGNLTSAIVTVNPVNTAALGSYTVTYNVSDSSGNAAVQVTRTVKVVDTTAPVITLLGTNPVTVQVGSTYTDAGATATDNYSGNLTSAIVTVNPVNTAALGTYTVTYNVSDSSGNHAVQVTRTIKVVDTTVPVITLLGTNPVIIEKGGSYTDAGATATDNYDGNLTSAIVTVNPVNTAVVGAYTVTYNVTDSSGNHAVQVTRTVHVEEADPRGTIDRVWTLFDATTLEDKYKYSDYAYDTSNVNEIALNGSSIVANTGCATVVGSVVTITCSGTYSISGTLTNGRIRVETAANDEGVVRLIFNGVNVTCNYSPPVYVANAKRTAILLADGTNNTLTDGTTYVYPADEAEELANAALYSKDYLTIGVPAGSAGTGKLTVNGKYGDGIGGKDGLVLNGGSITVNAVDDGIRGKDYIVVISGAITVKTTSTTGDGLKSDNTEDLTKGYISIEGGALTIQSGGDGAQAETYMLVYTGDITVKSGGGAGTSFNEDTESLKGLKGGAGVLIRDGAFALNSADDAVHSSNFVEIDGGDLDIYSGDDGIHGELNVLLQGGDIAIWNSYEGIEGAIVTFRDGTYHIQSTDDGVNCSGSTSMCLYIYGGYIAVYAQGDGLDSNGNIVMTGGMAIVHGPTANDNGALDIGDFGCSLIVDGGLLVGAGSSGMAIGPSTTSAQKSKLLTFNQKTAGTLCNIRSTDGTQIVTFKPSKQYASLAVSSPNFVQGRTYNVYFGGTYSGGTVTDGVCSGGSYSGGAQDTRLTFSF